MTNGESLTLLGMMAVGVVQMALNPVKTHAVITRGESWSGPSTGCCDFCHGLGAFGVACCGCGRTRGG